VRGRQLQLGQGVLSRAVRRVVPRPRPLGSQATRDDCRTWRPLTRPVSTAFRRSVTTRVETERTRVTRTTSQHSAPGSTRHELGTSMASEDTPERKRTGHAIREVVTVHDDDCWRCLPGACVQYPSASTSACADTGLVIKGATANRWNAEPRCANALLASKPPAPRSSTVKQPAAADINAGPSAAEHHGMLYVHNSRDISTESECHRLSLVSVNTGARARSPNDARAQ
jgi:hypothetical protein